MRLIMHDNVEESTESEDNPREPNQRNADQNDFDGHPARQQLPIFDVKDDLIEKLNFHDTVIILGETGCGKTTQIPKYILQRDINKTGQIVVTQPRRIAAVSIAHRVASELNEKCGETVGYKIRFKTETSLKTVLIYATDGTLLREAIKDPLLLKYNVIILDEAHERTVTTDILFAVVQVAQEQRKIQKLTLLKVIVMSAALDVDHFQSYFKNAPVFHIEGRHHRVDIYHTKDNIDDYYFTCLVSVFNIHAEAPANEDILVFLTGQEEIEKMAKDITATSRNPECTGPKVRVHTLYASADPNRQLEVFQPAPNGTRKIIISTNIAETSVTIPGIKYVIDSGKVKVKFHNPVTGVDVLKVQTISQEQALQRAGRAGRDSDGFCYRAYSTEFENMTRSAVPEIHRCSLSAVTLTLLAMNKNPQTFNFIDKPQESVIKESMNELLDLEAISSLEDLKLTNCGERMTFLPLEPKYSKMLLRASEFNCVDEILDIIAMLSTDNIYVTSFSYDTEVQEIKRKHYSSTGDHVTLLNVFRSFNKAKSKAEWCRDNYVSFRALDFATSIKKQLSRICDMFSIKISSCGPDSLDNVRKCLITGLFKNIAVLQSDKSYCTAITRQCASIHPSSVLHKSFPYCVIFTELMESNELYLKNITAIDAEWLPLCVPDFAAKKNLHIVSELHGAV